MLNATMTVLQVRDVKASAAFYERLGFTHNGFWGEGPDFCMPRRGDVSVALDRSRDGNVPVNQWWAAYIYVGDVGALHAEFSALDGVEVTELGDRFYGNRDFDVVDIDGHRIAFGQSLAEITGDRQEA